MVNVLKVAGLLAVLGVAFLFYYSRKTACPNVAVYVKCKNFSE